MKRRAAAVAGMAATVLAAGGAQAGEALISEARARSLFVLNCAGCHQIDGSGAPHAGVPSMRGNLGHFLGSAAGRAFLVQVPGARNSALSDAELAALTNWQLLSFSSASVPAGFTPYTTAEVTQSRGRPPSDVAAARAAILRELAEAGKLPAAARRELEPAAH